MPKKTKGSKRKKSLKTSVCSRYNCSDKKDLKKCRFCKEIFCEEHFKPFTPEIGLGGKVERHRGEDGHPCFAYVSHKEKENKKKLEKDIEGLDSLLGKKRVSKTMNVSKLEKSYSNVKEYLPKESKKERVYDNDMGKLAAKRFKDGKRGWKKKKVSSWKKYIPIIILVIFFLGLISYSTGFPLKWMNACDDGTQNGECSSDRPFYCSGKTLVENANECGCVDGYRPIENTCEKIPTCVGGVLYGECSTDKPSYCDNEGRLFEDASKCGCPYGEVVEGKRCIPA